MTLSRKELEDAAFWEQGVCLDCGAVVPAGVEFEEECPSCGSDAAYSAAFVLRCADFVEEVE